MNRFLAFGAFALAATTAGFAQPPGQRAGSPAAAPIPETLVAQEYSDELIEAGRIVFGSQCGFCHGLDTAGASGGPDLTRSELVARDVRGDLIGPVVRAGRLDAAVPMPAFPALSEGDLLAMVAFVHDQKARAESVEGGRRAVAPEDVQSGDVRAGQRYFESQCVECHSASGDLAGIAARTEGLALLQRMLYPRPAGGGDSRSAAGVVVTTADGTRYAGRLEYQDEFSLALTDADGRYRSFSTRDVSFEVRNPLQGHLDLLGAYTDEDMHDVLTYLHTLR